MRRRAQMALALLSGWFIVQCFGPDGRLKWEDTIKNGVTVVGRNHALDVVFGETAKASWFVGLIRDDSYSELAGGDTLASHAGWEEGDEYTGNRKGFVVAAADAGSVNNSASKAAFAINGTETMKGAFLCSAESGTSGVLYCTGLFTGGDRAVQSGDTLNVQYTCSLTAA